MEKTKKLMAGVVASIMTVSMAGCNNDPTYAAPTGTDCDDWDWDDESGTYYCDDDDSRYYGGYYYGGRYFSKKSDLNNFSSYKSYYNNYKSGIGSGSRGGFGG
ncbi:MAG TPA: hypothetical protein VNM69_12775 [Bacillus sp. (in: firmicutes)]|uniref:hypothetical protein n=1 Tax=Bacillus litorisediminis TaxID=2922713 RepID=UPI001FADEA67|nr:hypothetical protein [Bacillus litorisediminis]HWO76756.1 hypothetical protein [Bacillus sp. (in: firmicutes)]